jgi:hypothetical protein
MECSCCACARELTGLIPLLWTSADETAAVAVKGGGGLLAVVVVVGVGVQAARESRRGASSSNCGPSNNGVGCMHACVCVVCVVCVCV